MPSCSKIPSTLKLLNVSVWPTFGSVTKSVSVPVRSASSPPESVPVSVTGALLMTIDNVPVAVVLETSVEEVRSRTT